VQHINLSIDPLRLNSTLSIGMNRALFSLVNMEIAVCENDTQQLLSQHGKGGTAATATAIPRLDIQATTSRD